MKLLPLLLLLALPAVVQAQFTFTTNADNTLTLTAYTGSDGSVTIPGTIAGLTVTSIGDWAFYATSVTNVLIPDSVTNIGDGAFFDCQSLTNVTLGSSVVSLGDWTFGFCPSLTSVDCRGNAPSLGGGNVFYGNAVTVYYLPGTTGWGPLFDGHPAVLLNPVVPYIYATNNATITITEYTGSGGAITIPNTINFLPVTSLGNSVISAFFGPALTDVRIPNSVTNIANWAFAGASMTNVIIPDSVINIGYKAFSDCSSLTSVTIPGSVASIGGNAFEYSGLSSFTLANGVVNIGSNAFMNCWFLNSITIPSSVTNIGVAAFAGCSAVTNVAILNGVKAISIDAFTFCTSLTTVAIPNSVTTIEGNAFDACDSLTTVTIPASVTNISVWAFSFCPNLTGVYFDGNAPSLVGFEVFYASPNVTVYYLPGTTGWDTMLSDAPTALWLPQVQTDASLGLHANQFGFNINWASGQTVVVDACTNLSNPDWQPVQTNTLTTGTAYFSDPQWTNYPNRFYRLRSP